MEITEFLVHFADQFEETDSSFINGETKFRELDEWSSMNALSIIAMVDEIYGKTIDADDIKKANTVADLFNIVKIKINDKL